MGWQNTKAGSQPARSREALAHLRRASGPCLQLPLLLAQRCQLAAQRLQAGLRRCPLRLALRLLGSRLLLRAAGLAALGSHAGGGGHSGAECGASQNGQGSDVAGSSRCLCAVYSCARSSSCDSLQWQSIRQSATGLRQEQHGCLHRTCRDDASSAAGQEAGAAATATAHLLASH